MHLLLEVFITHLLVAIWFLLWYAVLVVRLYADKSFQILADNVKYCIFNKRKYAHLHFTALQILDWIVKICMALKYLHDQQILHKNLQPEVQI